MQSTIPQILTVVILILCINQQGIEARANRKTPITLDEETWTRLLEGEWMVDFYAPWCPACKKLEPEWKKFAEWSDDLNINVASADVTLNPGISGRFMVSGLPTIYHVKDGVFRQYTGPREHTALINFIEEQGWMKIEPISKWRAPSTLQMSFVAYSFRISLALRDVHNYMVEEVGLPYYVSYLIFALCTVTLGTILGLLIVFVIDQLVPPRYASVSQASASAGAAAAAAKLSSEKNKKRSDKTTSGSDLDESDANEQKPSSSSQETLRRRAKS